MRGLLQISCLTAVLLAAGCDSKPGREAAAPPGDEPPAPSAHPPRAPDGDGSAAPREANVPLEPLGLVDRAVHEEPAMGPWQGEVFNDLAGERLKELGKLLEHPEKLTAEALAPLLDPGFAPSALVPSGLEAAFDDGAYHVRRAGESGATAPADDAVAAFRELAAPFANAAGTRSKFKVFTVVLDQPAEPVCELYFHLSGRTAEGILARQATWRCAWSWPAPDAPPRLISIASSQFEETLGRAAEDAEPLFADCTAAVFAGVESFDAQLNRGMDYWAARLEKIYGIGQAGWHGLALGDANGDGLDDLYVCEPGGLPNRLYIRKPDGTLLDASQLFGTDFRVQTQAALFVDLDNDGDQDLALVTTLGLMLLANDGRGTFSLKVTHLIPEAAPLCIAAADYDLDGDLDLYLGSYSLRRAGQYGPQWHARPIPYHDANNGGRNTLFRNDRDWTFTNVTKALGLDADNRRFTLAASWEDYDGDGDPDLYVVNDFGRNCLYRNDRDENGDSFFTNVAREAGVEDISAGMSVTWSDVDGDGDRDLYVSNMWSSAGNRITYQRNFQAGVDASDLSEFQRHARGNSLFLNNGDGTFTDVSVETGVTMGRWAWASRFLDLNNDGWEDLVVANGFITQPQDPGDL